MKLTNKYNLPEPFVDAVNQEYTYKPKRYSVTSILSGTRETILKRRHNDEIESDVADMVWLIFGSAVHSILEKGQETDTQLKENYLSVEMPNGYTLSGIFDLYDDATGEVTDYKTGSVWKITFDDWKDYYKQLLAYCYMLRRIGFNAHRGKMVMLIKDHSKTKAAFEKDYPKLPIYVKEWEFSDDEIAGFERWATLKFEEIERCEKLPDSQLPLCTPEERWHKDDKYAVMKRGAKKASKLCDTKLQAREWIASKDDAEKYSIEFRAGEDTKCLYYCSAHCFCDHYKELINDRD